MQEKMKQRLIGIIVIIGALFVILPFLFHNSRPSAESKLSDNAPASPSVSVALPADSSTTDDTTVPSATPATTMPATSTTSTIPATTTMPATSTTSTTPAATTMPATSTTPTTPAATTMPATPTTPTTPAAQPTTTTPAAPASSQSATSVTAFSAAPGSLTTGQPNEGPTQPAPGVTATTPASGSPIKPVAQVKTKAPVKQAIKKQVVVRRVEVKKTPAFGSNNAWEVQLAVFSDKIYANDLIAKLRSHHFEVYSRDIIVDQRRLTAVFVGPEIDLNKAEMIQRRLKQEFHLNGVVRKYQA